MPLLLKILLLLGHKELNHSLFRTSVAISGWSAYAFMKQCCLLISHIQSGGHTMVSNYTEGCWQNIAIYMSANICCRNTEHNISQLGSTEMTEMEMTVNKIFNIYCNRNVFWKFFVTGYIRKDHFDNFQSAVKKESFIKIRSFIFQCVSLSVVAVRKWTCQ